MTLVKFNPEKKNNALMPGFNDIFESVLSDSFFADRKLNTLPAVNISETPESFHIELAAPGLKKEDFKVSVERETLTISTQQESQSSDRTYNKREFSFHSFTRAFTLPESANVDGIQASYNDGILMLTIPKKEEAKMVTRQIEIQ
ncbi:Hsp20/alpha crystallin family protein [Pedobacter sp. BMA]|uniref:Hsp20/alpha crystallin family protein n=1 Tax=Pedobacter sp. BMA TaxID=1663685 RepID=UPI000649E54B|nr:Hsp20/alpha crystallin family protein [Pedobacter sp. BMA]KLT66716.1 heat-shock protein [Pedobacter sp. BMA]